MRILHILPMLDGGGIERIVYDYYVELKDNFFFDFAVPCESKGILEQSLLDYGCQIFRIPKLHDGILIYCKALADILKDNKYDAIHYHVGYKAFPALFVAKKCGIKIRIAHAHTSYNNETFSGKIVRTIWTILTKYYSTDLFACGKVACKWCWGQNSLKNGDVYFMRNAINTNSFKFDLNQRKRMRKELEIEEKTVISHVGRLSEEKNQFFLLEVFKEIQEYDSNTVLLMVGRGELENQLLEEARKLGISDSVKFLGIRNDVNSILSASDFFAMPSKFEGFPVTLVEAQTNGLRVFASDAITREIEITDTVEFIPLKKNSWVDAYFSKKPIDLDRRIMYYSTVHEAGYDIKIEARKLMTKYCKIKNDVRG